jgi:RNA polymerase sigma factor (sigma-70 family)
MAKTPTTSTTLLRDLARDSQHARWGEFVARYRPMMEAYLRERFPHVDVDDAVQETLIALIKSMPVYRYVPEETGRFHSYLTGILRHRALRQVRSDRKRAKIREVLCQNEPQNEIQDDEQSWREALMEIALQQLLADESVHARTREVFRRVAVNGEKPEDVGSSLGITRNAVDQMKSRMTLRLKELVRALEKADGNDRQK